MLHLDRFLRRCDPLGDQLRFDGHIFFHAQPQHQLLHALTAEDAHQIVLQRQIKTGAAWIALASGASAKLVVDAPRFMPLGSHNVQTAQRHYFLVIAVGLFLELGQRRFPLFFRNLVGILGLLAQKLLGLNFRIAAQQNVGSAAGHVGGYGHRPLAAGLGHDRRFTLVVLRVQDLVLHAHLFQNARQPFRLLHRNGAHQHWLPDVRLFLDLFRGVAEFFFLGAIDQVRVVHAHHRHVRRNHDHVQLVSLPELRRFGLGRTRHAGQFLEHAEIILERDGRQRLILALDLHALFGFHRLVQPVAPAPPRHQPTGELVHDNHLAVFHHVFAIQHIQHVRAQALLHVMVDFDHRRVVQILDVEQLFDLGYALLGQPHAAMLLIHCIVAGGPFLTRLLPIVDFAFFELGNNAVDLVILVCRFLARSGDDQRRARLVDQNRIHFVHDGVVMLALHAVLDPELHVVAKIVEPKLVVGAVSDVAVVGYFPLLVVEVVDDHADGQSQELVEPAHPLGVALGQVVVDRDHVHAFAFERVQINGQRRHQRLTFTGFHFRDFALMQHHPAD